MDQPAGSPLTLDPRPIHLREVGGLPRADHVDLPPCPYRGEFAGFPVCRAMARAAIATATDCRLCPVPSTVDRAQCALLRPTVELAPEVQVQWTCTATDEPVDPNSQSGCLGCRSG